MIELKDLWPTIKSNLPVALAGVILGCFLAYQFHIKSSMSLANQEVSIQERQIEFSDKMLQAEIRKLTDAKSALSKCGNEAKSNAASKLKLRSDMALLQSEHTKAVNQLNDCNAGATKVSADAAKLAQVEQRLAAAESQLKSIIDSTTLKLFVTGDRNPGNGGTSYGCYEEATARSNICGETMSPITEVRYKSEKGGRCGYNYYVVACLPTG